MSFLSRLFNPISSTDIVTYTVVWEPGVPTTEDTRTTAFRPEVVAVEHRNGRFRYLRIGGPSTTHPGIRVTRQYDKLRDVPEWARKYVTAPDHEGA
jgi:hypothetical protein